MRGLRKLVLVCIYKSIFIPTEGEGGPRAYVGHLTSVAFPSIGIWVRAWASGWGCGHLEVGWLRGYKHLFWINKTPPLSTHFQYKLIKFLMLWRLCAFLIHSLAFCQTIKHWNEYFPSINSKKLHLLKWMDDGETRYSGDIWSDFIHCAGPVVGIFTQTFKCPTYSQMPHIQLYMYAWGAPPLAQKYNDRF